MVIWNSPLLITLASERETWKPSSSKMALGSGDHQVTGLTVQGKIPLPYASNSRGTLKSPPIATKPSESARRGSGKRKRLSTIPMAIAKGPLVRSLSQFKSHLALASQGLEQMHLKITRQFHCPKIR